MSFFAQSSSTRSTVRFILSLLLLGTMVAAIPLGVHIIENPSNFIQQASAPSVVTGKNTFVLEAEDSTPSTVKMAIKVNVQKNPVNVVVAKFAFPPNLLQVAEIATSSAQPNHDSYVHGHVLESSFDNKAGTISIVESFAPTPLQTDATLTPILASVSFTPQHSGIAAITQQGGSFMYTQNENIDSLDGLSQVTIPIASVNPIDSQKDTCSIKPICLNNKVSCKVATPQGGWCPSPVSLQVLSPKGGDVFAYYSTFPVSIESQGLSRIALWLDIDGKRLGRVSYSNPTSSITISRIIPKSFVGPLHTFSFEVSGIDSSGKTIYSPSSGPFSVMNTLTLPASVSMERAKRNADINQDGVVNFTDLSILVSHLNQTNVTSKEGDLNEDGVVNMVDEWLLQQILIQNGKIH